MDQATLSNEQFAALADRGDMSVDAGGRVYQVEPTQHIDQRSSEDMGDRKINAFQFDHPEVHQYYSEAAAELLNELSVSERGGQLIRRGDYQTGYEYTRTRRAAPERISTLRDDFGLSYGEIEQALNAIIHNHGQENVAAAKRVEFVLDDMLTNGYQSMNEIHSAQPGLHQRKGQHCRIRKANRGRKRVSGRDRRSAGDGRKDGTKWTAESRAGRRRI